MYQTTLNQRAQQAARHKRFDSWRFWTVLLVFTAFASYNAVEVFSVQVLQYNTLAPMAESRITWKDTIAPRRGLIYDSRGELLAGNTTAYDIYVDKTHLDDKDLRTVSDLLAPVLSQTSAELYSRLTGAPEGVTNVKLAARMLAADTDKVRAVVNANPTQLGLVVSYEPYYLRQYPNNTFAAALLGFTDHDNKGYYGIEEYYDAQLAGEAGWITAEHDAQGRPLVLQQPETQPAKDGSDLILTIDSAVQYLAERELKTSIDQFKADSGFIVVEDPSTGGILAMANYPTFDPNLFNKVDTANYSIFKNPAVNDLVEPGSTMKILTYSSSLDAGAITPSTSFFANACVIRYGWRICNATYTTWGNESMLLGLGRSDNIASMFAAEQEGQDNFYKYVKAYGIGQRTGIDLAGEVSGLVSWPGDDSFSPINLDTNSFGQGIAVTPIQLVSAAAAVANGGKLVKPHVVQRIEQNGNVIQSFQPQIVRQVIKPETASTLADMLAYGVENRLVARYAAVPGYHVSVKTGTAQIPSDGGYLGSGSFASTMGWAPSQGAKFVLYIGLVNPKSSQWGENTASIAWGRLAKQLLLYMKVQPTEPIPTPTP